MVIRMVRYMLSALGTVGLSFELWRLRRLYVDVEATKAGRVGYVLCARTSTGEFLILL